MMILDLETDNLYPQVTTIHCAVIYDTETGGCRKFVPDDYPVGEYVGKADYNPLMHLTTFLDDLPQLSCHNGIGFDLKVLKKILGYTYNGVYVDTLLLSRILFPDLDNASYLNEDGEARGVKNPHSIESWGLRFGIHKPEHEDWSKFTPEMLHRCTEDTKIQGRLWEYLQDTIKEYIVRGPQTQEQWKTIINMEQKVWSLIEEQADYGWAFDLRRAYDLVDELQRITKDIEEKLIPLLPIKVIQVATKETRAFNANGSVSVNAARWINGAIFDHDLMGDFSKVKFQPFNIRSS